MTLTDKDKYILAFDTSGPSLSVAVLKDELIVAEKFLNISNQHSINFLPALDSLMQEIELTYDQLAALAVTVGPGSFTGIRIGVSTANTMAYGLDIPVLGFSSLRVLAESVKNQEMIILPSFDARGGRVFAGLFQDEKRLIADQQFVDNELPALLKDEFRSEDIYYLLGDGFTIVQELLKKNGIKYFRADSFLNEQDYISARPLAFMARRELLKNPELYHNGFNKPVEPNYCVVSQAERNLAQKAKQ